VDEAGGDDAVVEGERVGAPGRWTEGIIDIDGRSVARIETLGGVR